MKKTYLRWILAVLITLSAALYQRLTGPTYPLRGSLALDEQRIKYKFLRTHEGESDQPVELRFADSSYTAQILYRRYKTDDDWTKIPMQYQNGQLRGQLPNQPPAGKLEYYILLEKNEEQHSLPNDRTVVTRFKGTVPMTVLIPHILLMFVAMLFSNLSGLEALVKGKNLLPYTVITVTCLFIGGIILGPIVQKFAFGEFWTGIPFGYDLTDNKTLLAMVGWLIALVQVIRQEQSSARWWVIAASLTLLMVYSIPHSTLGSELDYKTMEIIQGN